MDAADDAKEDLQHSHNSQGLGLRAEQEPPIETDHDRNNARTPL